MLAHPGADSVRVGWDDVAGCGAEVVLVAPCGYHLDGAAELAAAAVAAGVLPPEAEVWALDADALRRAPRLSRRRRHRGDRLDPPPRPCRSSRPAGGAAHRLTRHLW